MKNQLLLEDYRLLAVVIIKKKKKKIPVIVLLSEEKIENAGQIRVLYLVERQVCFFGIVSIRFCFFCLVVMMSIC